MFLAHYIFKRRIIAIFINLDYSIFRQNLFHQNPFTKAISLKEYFTEEMFH